MTFRVALADVPTGAGTAVASVSWTASPIHLDSTGDVAFLDLGSASHFEQLRGVDESAARNHWLVATDSSFKLLHGTTYYVHVRPR